MKYNTYIHVTQHLYVKIVRSAERTSARTDSQTQNAWLVTLLSKDRSMRQKNSNSNILT